MPAVLLKDAPGSQQHQGLVCLSGDGYAVTSTDWQNNVINSAVQRRAVAQAIKGTITAASIAPEEWTEREMMIGAKLGELGLPMFDQYQVEYASNGEPDLNDRFVTDGLGRRQILEACRKAGLKIYSDNAESADYNGGDTMPTRAGVLTLNFTEAMVATDIVGRPYCLNMTDQLAWAKEQGGDGLLTVEEVLYLFLRSALERGRPLWSTGSCRCANASGSGCSLCVHWYAGDGLSVHYYGRSEQRWHLGALPRKFQALNT